MDPEVIRLSLANFVVKSDNPDAIKLVPHPTAPRIPTQQEDQELFVARQLASVVRQQGDRVWVQLRPNPDDPPDIIGLEGQTTFGLEVGEIRLQDRACDVSQLSRLRDKIYAELPDLRPRLKGKTLKICFEDPLALKQQLPKRRVLRRIIRSVKDGAKRCADGDEVIALDSPFKRLTLLPHPCVSPPPHPDDPGLVFDAETQATSPDQVREAARVITKKKLQVGRFAFDRNYLLLWSRDQEIIDFFEAAKEGALSGIRDAGLMVPETERVSPHDEIHLMAFSNHGYVTHFSIRRDK